MQRTMKIMQSSKPYMQKRSQFVTSAAAFTAIGGILTAPFCWILKDGLLEAYPSHGLGALSHFFRCFLWGLWPTLTFALAAIAAKSRPLRIIFLVLLTVCLGIFLLPYIYAKTMIPEWDSPFLINRQITLWQNGQEQIYTESDDIYCEAEEKLWDDWTYSHNSTHCLRILNSRISDPIARCQLSHATIIWGEKQVEITTERGTYTRAVNQQDNRLLRYLQAKLRKH